jgi:hypothetical protein
MAKAPGDAPLVPTIRTQSGYFGEEFWNILSRVGYEIVVRLGRTGHFNVLGTGFDEIRSGETFSPLKTHAPRSWRGRMATLTDLGNLAIG